MQTPDEASRAPCARPGITAYRRGCRCDGCRAANTARCRAAQDRRVARAADSDFEHGVSGYNNWNCRCPVCTKAHTEACRPAVARFAAKQARRDAPNRRAPWKPHEDDLLLRDDLSLSEIATQLGRSYGAVSTRRSFLRHVKEAARADA